MAKCSKCGSVKLTERPCGQCQKVVYWPDGGDHDHYCTTCGAELRPGGACPVCP